MTRQRRLLIMALGEFLRNRAPQPIDEILHDIKEYFGATDAVCTYRNIDVKDATRLNTLLLDRPVTFSVDLEDLPDYVTSSYNAKYAPDQDEPGDDPALEELDGDRG